MLKSRGQYLYKGDGGWKKSRALLLILLELRIKDIPSIVLLGKKVLCSVEGNVKLEALLD